MRTRPKIEFLFFEGCPLADTARRSLQKALDLTGLDGFEEIDILDSATPDDYRLWGSPTILVEGNDVAGNVKGEGIGCRVYGGSERVPSPDQIAAVIRKTANSV